MRRTHFLTRRAHSQSHHHTRRRHPKYHRSQSRRTRRTKYSLRRRRGGSNNDYIVVANSKGKVYTLNERSNPILNTNTTQLPGDDDI